MSHISDRLNSVIDELEMAAEGIYGELDEEDLRAVEHLQHLVDQLKGQTTPTVDWDSFYKPGVPHVYMVWAHPQGAGLDVSGELRAICSTRAKAAHYKRAVEHENSYRSNPYNRVDIEQRRLNHFYGAGMIWALRNIPIPDDVPDEVREELEEALGRTQDEEET